MKNKVTRLWIQNPKPNAVMRLICFPYAGGGASIFRDWDLGENIEIAAVQLPGREWRRNETSLISIATIVEDIFEDVIEWTKNAKYIAFFGYSMGSVISYSLSIKLEKMRLRIPDILVVAASQAPQVMGKKEPIYKLPDELFISKIHQFGGMPDTIMKEPTLLELAIPALRSDFQALYNYTEYQLTALPCPLMVYGGKEDPHVSLDNLSSWHNLTTSMFNIRLFNGGHFFINTTRSRLLKTLQADLYSVLK